MRRKQQSNAERVGLAVSECLHSYGFQPVTFTAEELASFTPKAQELIKMRLRVWFEAQCYTPKAVVYAERKVSIRQVWEPALEPDAKLQPFIGPRTDAVMLTGTPFDCSKDVKLKSNTNPIAVRQESSELWKKTRKPRLIVWPDQPGPMRPKA